MAALIRQAEDWRALSAFVDAKGPAMDAEQAVLVLFKVRQLHNVHNVHILAGFVWQALAEGR